MKITKTQAQILEKAKRIFPISLIIANGEGKRLSQLRKVTIMRGIARKNGK